MDKPLHVRVADALGQKAVYYHGIDRTGWWSAVDMSGELLPVGELPRYDIDWSATGPLIERYAIKLIPPVCCLGCEHHPDDSGASNWTAVDEADVEEATGPTPLIAICGFILALKEAGKL